LVVLANTHSIQKIPPKSDTQNDSALQLTMGSPIPSVWRIWFATLDPIIAFSGVAGNILVPQVTLKAYDPNATIPPALVTKIMLDMTTGFLAGTMFLQIVLLRLRPKDVAVWKCLQASISFADVAIIYSVLMGLDAQGRLDPEKWRVEEIGTLGLTGFVLLTRVLFILGIGLSSSRSSDVKLD
jgi:hypothetical protein